MNAGVASRPLNQMKAQPTIFLRRRLANRKYLSVAAGIHDDIAMDCRAVDHEQRGLFEPPALFGAQEKIDNNRN
jgi:hypothetical protein